MTTATWFPSQMHASALFLMIHKNPECNVFSSLPPAQFEQCRKLAIGACAACWRDTARAAAQEPRAEARSRSRSS